MSRSYPKVFDKPLDTLNNFPSTDQKTDLAIAMALSTDLKYPFSWLHIHEECKFDIHYQRVYGICLTKKEARGLIEDFSVEKIGEAAFLKNYTKARYQELFSREAPLGEKKAMLATHAEWLHLCGYSNHQLPFPEIFSKWLPEDWDSRRENAIRKFNLPPTVTLFQQSREYVNRS
jgi:hypothetical protein